MRNRARKPVSVMRIMVVTLLLAFAFALTSQAALPKVKITKAKAGVKKVTLKWQRAAGAKGYIIYTVNDDNTLKQVAKVGSGTTLKKAVTKLKNGKTYKFAVAAYAGSEVGPPSDPVSATPQIGNPGKVREARLLKNKSKKVWLKWAYNAKATGYQILMPDENGEYQVVKTIPTNTKLKAKVANLKNGQSYSFKIRAYIKKGSSYGYGPMSKTIVGRPLAKSVLKAIGKIHTYYFKAKLTRTVTTGGVTLKKGKKVTIVAWNKGRTGYATYFKIKYGNSTLKIPADSVKFTSVVCKASAAYNQATAEAFVNARGFASVTNYLVWISTYTQHMYVFQGKQYDWKLVMDTPCSTGMRDKSTTVHGEIAYTETPITDSQITRKEKCVPFAEFSGGWYQVGYWANRVAGGFIHSWLYSTQDKTGKTIGKLYNKESYGSPKSHGCIRIPIAKAKWIYDNCPINTSNITY